MEEEKEMTLEEATKKLLDFQRDQNVQTLESMRSRRTVLDWLGVRDDEACHSSFLSELFSDPNVGHEAIRLLLLLLVEKGTTSVPEYVKKRLLVSQLEDVRFEVTTEKWIDVKDKEEGRFDIYIEGYTKGNADEKNLDIVIIIENKIWSNEHDDQTEKYWNWVEQEKLNGKAVCTFLTPILKEGPQDSHFIHITYQDLLDSVILPILNDIHTPEEVKWKLTDYVNSLCFSKSNKGIIAMDKDIKEMLGTFFENYKDLIIAAIKAQAAKLKDKGDEDGAKEFEEAEDSLRSANDKTKYKIVDTNGSLIGDNLTRSGIGGKKGNGCVVVRAIQELFGRGITRNDIDNAWQEAVQADPQPVIVALGAQATSNVNNMRKPTQDRLFGRNKCVEVNDKNQKKHTVASDWYLSDIDYVVYMVNVKGKEKGWPIRIEKMQ